MEQPPNDRSLDTPGEANRDKHINFREAEESTWLSGREDKDTDSLVLTAGEKELHNPEKHKVSESGPHANSDRDHDSDSNAGTVSDR